MSSHIPLSEGMSNATPILRPTDIEAGLREMEEVVRAGDALVREHAMEQPNDGLSGSPILS